MKSVDSDSLHTPFNRLPNMADDYIPSYVPVFYVSKSIMLIHANYLPSSRNRIEATYLEKLKIYRHHEPNQLRLGFINGAIMHGLTIANHK